MLKMIVMYVIISIMVGFLRIRRCAKYEKAMMQVPAGDYYLYQPPKLLDLTTTVFLPATAVILIWMFIVMIVDTIKD